MNCGQETITRNKNFPKYPVYDTWEYLGSDDAYDYYVVNEQSGHPSLTGVYGSIGGDYWSNPIYHESEVARLQGGNGLPYVLRAWELYISR